MHTFIVYRRYTMKNTTSSHSELAERMAALAHPARIAILRQLATQECCCCKDVVGGLDLAQSTVSQHLRVLVDSGLVRMVSQRPRSLYSVDRTALAALRSAMTDLVDTCCQPETAACRDHQ